MKLNTTDKIFTIGSCFAREIRYWLTNNGFDVTPAGEASQLVYYNTYSILYEFFPPANREIDIVQNSNGQWQEPTRRMVLSNSKEMCIDVSRSLTRMMQRWIQDADIFIITLGMTECFKSKNLVWCAHPQYGLKAGVRSGGLGKVEFFNSSVEQNYSNLEKIVKAHPEKRFVFTVSPVPLKKTFNPQFGKDTKAANEASKFTLRQVAQSIATNHASHVSYFDSFEFCMELHKQSNIYMPDGRHVKKEVVEQVVKRFLNKYYDN